MRGQGYLGSTSLLQELEKIRVRQGVNGPLGSGGVYGMITTNVGTSASKIIFGGITTPITAPVDGETTWVIDNLSDYTYIITLNGTGLLVPGVDYSVVSNTITRLGGFEFTDGEIYTIMLFNK